MNKERRIEQLEFEIAERGTDILELRNQLAEARADLRLAKNIIQTHVERVAERDKLIEQMRAALGEALGVLPKGYKEYEKCEAALSAAERGE